VDFYIVLGLSQEASETEIKRAYRRLARRLHPDINPGDRAAEARFREVVEAYETLIDRERRTRYDAGHQSSGSARARRSEFQGFDFSTTGADYSASFGDLFAEVLMEREARPGPIDRGNDRHHELRLPFRQALAGGDSHLIVSRLGRCRVCEGRGLTAMGASACAMCHGTGAVKTVRGHMVFSRACTACGGTGEARPRACRSCGGSGQAMQAETLTVRIPPGIANGETIRVADHGDVGVRGGPAGDLYVGVHVDADPVFTRHGDDLHMLMPVAVHDAALGAKIDVEGPDGTVRVRVPPGTQSGQRFRFSGRGAPSPRTGARGDLVVEARLMLPAVLDERSKALLREFGRLNGAGGRAEEAGQGQERGKRSTDVQAG
jgi:molecular chaperone DnaJ